MRCKNCKEKFTPKRFNWKYCDKDICHNIGVKELVSKVRTQKKKQQRKETKQARERIKTKSDWLKDLQVVFNKFIRLRDSGLNCISCNKPPKKKNAGHYRSVGANPELRFTELNCHLQCEHCNTYLHGNLINYRINLINKIGVDQVEKLESSHDPVHLSIPEIQEKIKQYKQKIKEI
tara:strand:- start:3351 stop:3881 length:531 start_codon:yes stop_codon:yes gene_type:complete